MWTTQPPWCPEETLAPLRRGVPALVLRAVSPRSQVVGGRQPPRRSPGNVALLGEPGSQCREHSNDFFSGAKDESRQTTSNN